MYIYIYMSCPGLLPSPNLLVHACDLYLISYPDVCFTSPVCNILSIFVCTAVSLFFAGECSCVRAVCRSWNYAMVVYLSLQAHIKYIC